MWNGQVFWLVLWPARFCKKAFALPGTFQKPRMSVTCYFENLVFFFFLKRSLWKSCLISIVIWLWEWFLYSIDSFLQVDWILVTSATLHMYKKCVKITRFWGEVLFFLVVGGCLYACFFKWSFQYLKSYCIHPNGKSVSFQSRSGTTGAFILYVVWTTWSCRTENNDQIVTSPAYLISWIFLFGLGMIIALLSLFLLNIATVDLANRHATFPSDFIIMQRDKLLIKIDTSLSISLSLQVGGRTL